MIVDSLDLTCSEKFLARAVLLPTGLEKNGWQLENCFGGHEEMVFLLQGPALESLKGLFIALLQSNQPTVSFESLLSSLLAAGNASQSFSTLAKYFVNKSSLKHVVTHATALC